MRELVKQLELLSITLVNQKIETSNRKAPKGAFLILGPGEIMNFLVLILILSSLSFAQVSTPPYPTEESLIVPEMVKPETSPVEKVIQEADTSIDPGAASRIEEIKTAMDSSTRANRADSLGSVMVGYQLITSWLPSKKTIGYTHIFNEKWSLEAEFTQSSVSDPVFWLDIGEVREERFYLQARRYAGNSFNFSFGGTFSNFRAKLGSDFLGDAGQELTSSFGAENIGVTGGIGNRWQWSNGLTVGIDWIRINVPVVSTYVRDDVLDAVAEDDEQDDLEGVIETFNRIPTFVLFGLNIGYTF